MTKSLRHSHLLIKYLPSALIGGFAVFIAVKLGGEMRSLSSLPWARFGIVALGACALSIGNYLLRFLRWQMFLRSLGLRPGWLDSMLCYLAGFAFTLLPGKVGELVRARYYTRIGVSADRVSAAFVVERLLDFAAICLLCLFGASAFSDSAWFKGLLAVGLVIAAVSLVLIPLALRFVDPLSGDAPLDKPEQPAKAGMLAKLVKVAASVYRHGRVLMQPGPLSMGLLLGLVAWWLEGIGFWLLVRASGAADMQSWQAVCVYSASLMAGALSFMPGGLGSTEAVMLLSLKHFGVDAAAALVVTLLCRLATLWLSVVIGWCAVGWLSVRERSRTHAA